MEGNTSDCAVVRVIYLIGYWNYFFVSSFLCLILYDIHCYSSLCIYSLLFSFLFLFFIPLSFIVSLRSFVWFALSLFNFLPSFLYYASLLFLYFHYPFLHLYLMEGIQWIRQVSQYWQRLLNSKRIRFKILGHSKVQKCLLSYFMNGI
jgi:hypothetical protein